MGMLHRTMTMIIAALLISLRQIETKPENTQEASKARPYQRLDKVVKCSKSRQHSQLGTWFPSRAPAKPATHTSIKPSPEPSSTRVSNPIRPGSSGYNAIILLHRVHLPRFFVYARGEKEEVDRVQKRKTPLDDQPGKETHPLKTA
jgi:hypothetical protein